MTKEEDELKCQRLWGWVAEEGRPLLKSEAATKICPVMTAREITLNPNTNETTTLAPMLCQTTDCMAFQEQAISGKIHCRCGMLPQGEDAL